MKTPIQVTLQDGDRDLTFEITPFSAFQAERFAIKLGKLALKTKILTAIKTDSITSSADVAGMMRSVIRDSDGFAALGDVDEDRFFALHDELLAQVMLVTPGGAKLKLTQTTVEGNISDFRTVFKVVWESFKLNFDFFTVKSGPISALSPQAPAPQSGPRKPKISVQS